MDQSMSYEENRQTEVYRSGAIQMESTPPEAEGHDEVDDTKVAYEVWIERACVWDGGREIRVPRKREAQHPQASNEAEEARDHVEAL